MDKMQAILQKLNTRTTDERAPMLSDAFYRAVCLSNDMKHIHAHATGRKFDTLHAMCQEYYQRATEDADTLLELAIEYKHPVSNANDAAAYVSHTSENAERYDWGAAMSAIHDRLSAYIDGLQALAQDAPSEDAADQIRGMLRYWKKELNYKMAARMEGER